MSSRSLHCYLQSVGVRHALIAWSPRISEKYHPTVVRPEELDAFITNTRMSVSHHDCTHSKPGSALSFHFVLSCVRLTGVVSWAHWVGIAKLKQFKLAVCEKLQNLGRQMMSPKILTSESEVREETWYQHKAFRELTPPPSARWRVLRQNEWHTCIHALQYTQVIQGPVSPFQHTECEFEHLIRNQRNGKIDTSLTVQLFHSLHVTRVIWSVYLSTYSHSLCLACLCWSRVPINLKLSCRGPRSVQVTHQPAHRGLRVPAQHVCCWCVRSYVHCFFMLRHTDVWVRFRGMWLHWKRRLRVFFPLKYLRTFSPSRLKLKTEPHKVILKWCALVSRCWVVV